MNLDIFLEDLSENQRSIVLYLHDLITSYPQVNIKMRFNIPFYDRFSWFCYINPKRKIDGVELCFIHGNKMPDTSGLLEFRGRVQVGGVLIHGLQKLNEEAIILLINEALMVDEEISRKK